MSDTGQSGKDSMDRLSSMTSAAAVIFGLSFAFVGSWSNGPDAWHLPIDWPFLTAALIAWLFLVTALIKLLNPNSKQSVENTISSAWCLISLGTVALIITYFLTVMRGLGWFGPLP